MMPPGVELLADREHDVLAEHVDRVSPRTEF
jgi:hypothetical protein